MLNIKRTLLALAVLSVGKVDAVVEDVEAVLQDYVQELQIVDNQIFKDIASVGEGEDCNFDTIQKAIDSGADLVRIVAAETDYIENLVIQNSDVHLQGNFASCEDANAGITSDVKAVIDGDQTGRVLLFQKSEGTEQRNKLSHLVIQNANLNNLGGGVVAFDINLLFLEDVIIQNNVAQLGGGIYASDSRVYINDSVLQSNAAVQGQGLGGAIFSNRTVILDGDTKVKDNTALSGGGLYGKSLIFSPVSITGNNASESGGGIYYSGEQSDLYGQSICVGGYCFGSSSCPVLIEDNSSDLFGGGVYVDSFSTNVDIFNARFIQNKAMSDGGAIYKESGSETLRVDSSYFEENRADMGVVAVVSGDEGEFNSQNLIIQNSLIVNNGEDGFGGEYDDANLIFQSGLGSIKLNYNTVAGNFVTDELTFSKSADNLATFTGNIFDDVDVFRSGNPEADYVFGCTLVQNDSGLVAQPEIVVGDADFINPAEGNYRLGEGSVAIDFCDQFDAPLIDKDGVPRGEDSPVANKFGPYDLGAYESSNILIFKSDFEGVCSFK